MHATRGIVLHTVKYSETSLIVRIYTEHFGLQSYLVKGSRSPKSKNKPALFQHLSLLNLVVYHKERHTIQSLREVHLAIPYQSIPFDIRKSSVLLFMNELIYKVIREEEANPALFAFLWEQCSRLDMIEESPVSVPVNFMIGLMPYLGITPQNNYSTTHPIFDLREGQFQPAIPFHPDYLPEETSRLLASALSLTPSPLTRHASPSSTSSSATTASTSRAFRNSSRTTSCMMF